MDALVLVGRGSVGTWDVYARDPKDLHLGTIREGKDNYLHVVAVRGTLLEGIPPVSMRTSRLRWQPSRGTCRAPARNGFHEQHASRSRGPGRARRRRAFRGAGG